jgi:predicted small lipoprotein YifL
MMIEPCSPKLLRIATAVAASVLFAVAGCGKKDAAPPPPAQPSADKAAPAPATDRAVKIISITPEVDALKAGDTVKIALSASYTVPAQGGLIGIVAQDAKGTLIVDKLTPVEGGSGTFVGELEFKVPATDRVSILVPLYAKGENKSSTIATHQFTVKAK